MSVREGLAGDFMESHRKRVRCVLPERAMYASALCRWVDVGLGPRGLGEGDKQSQSALFGSISHTTTLLEYTRVVDI